ncbi:hypothetical protein ARMGADRAFT_1121328 [Armillaria gallica]|uniref:DUF6534 domain-containing protein n=1 Tax=Armillaria gallica TaxID=47427 RepID=A0A2H3DL01_ARMGA|nr:hypothetical protein ARMGADRAFT_1121328 [Armillaria gallica]
MSDTVSAMVQSFYVWRIYNLTKNIWVSLIIEVVTVQGLDVEKLRLAVSSEVSLYRASSRSDFGTTGAVTKIIPFTVETGLLTSTAAVIEFILWLTRSEYNLHYIGILVLGKLYSNALVATLNSRALIFWSVNTGAYTDSSGSSGLRTSNPFWDNRPRGQTHSTDTRSQAMYITRTTDVQGDESHEMIVVSDLRRAAGGDLEIGARGHDNYEAKYGEHRVHL